MNGTTHPRDPTRNFRAINFYYNKVKHCWANGFLANRAHPAKYKLGIRVTHTVYRQHVASRNRYTTSFVLRAPSDFSNSSFCANLRENKACF